MRQFKLMFLMGVAAVFFLTGWALAQGKPAQGGQTSPMMGCQERLNGMDTNHDGTVTKEEFMAVPHHRDNAEQMFKAMDVNGDGALTKDEFCAGKGMGQGMGKGMGKGVNQ